MLPAKAPRERRGPLIVLRALAAAALSLAALAVAAGCGDDEAGPAGDDGSPEGATELTITLDADGPGGEDPVTEEVSCAEGTGGEAACEALAAVSAADLGPVGPDVACTEIYGGPDEAQVEGELHGEAVAERLTRANGCEIERFDHLVPALRELFPGYVPGAALQSGY